MDTGSLPSVAMARRRGFGLSFACRDHIPHHGKENARKSTPCIALLHVAAVKL